VGELWLLELPRAEQFDHFILRHAEPDLVEVGLGRASKDGKLQPHDAGKEESVR
jgi:hypothetical protein